MCLNKFDDVDDLMNFCCEPLFGPDAAKDGVCEGPKGARLVTERGIRIKDLATDVRVNDEDVYLVPVGRLFMWPNKLVGRKFVPLSVPAHPDGSRVSLKTLSTSPRVLSVENFATDKEILEIIETNRNRVTPSEVGFAGKTGDPTRNSSTAG